jgi:hypothetical protein
MYKTTKELIEQLNDQEKLIIIQEYEELEKGGFIGDCLLRELAKEMTRNRVVTVLNMSLIGMETYRYFANKWLYETDAGMNLQQKGN